MEFTCQRCGETLSTEAAFCPHCAAPQLRWLQPDAAETTEAVPPAEPINPRHMHWDAAIRLTLAASLITGLLCGFLSPGLLLWVVCGTAVTITFYRRRHPAPPVDSRFGTRIGILFGLLTAFVSTAVVAGAMLYQRYFLHQGAKIDQMYQPIDTQIDQAAAHAASTAGNSPQMAALTRLFHSPEAHAGSFIFGTAILAVFLIALAGATGAITARLSHPKPRTS